MELGDPQVILLGMDRLDYTKGILHRLRAYESLLDSGLLGPPQAVFVQVASPSRDRVNQYQQLLLDVEALVGRINGEHATLSQPAVRYLHHSYPREEIAALYLAADVMLVTSLRDGMNLVAKEYVCCRHHEDGALVLSEFTGASDELGSAFLVNPHDIQGLKRRDPGGGSTEPTGGAAPDAVTTQTSPRPRRHPLGRHLPRRPPRHRSPISRSSGRESRICSGTTTSSTASSRALIDADKIMTIPEVGQTSPGSVTICHCHQLEPRTVSGKL